MACFTGTKITTGQQRFARQNPDLGSGAPQTDRQSHETGPSEVDSSWPVLDPLGAVKQVTIKDRWYQVAEDPNRPPEAPKPPREMVEDLTEGRLAADLATWVRPVAEPTFLLSAVRYDLGSLADR